MRFPPTPRAFLIAAFLCFLSVSIYLGVLARSSVWHVDQANYAPFDDKALRLSGDHIVRQDVTPSRGYLDGILLRALPSPAVGGLRVRILAYEGKQIDANKGVLVTNHDFHIASGGNIPDGQWYFFEVARTVLAPGRSITIQLETPAGSEITLAREIDNQAYPDGKLFFAGHEQRGDLGFVTLDRASARETIAYQLTSRDKLAGLITILLLICLLLFIWTLAVERIYMRSLLFFVLALLYSFPLYLDGSRWGVWDWSEAASYYSAAQHSFAAGQFPLWNPYFCGGAPIWHDPQPYWPSLTFLLTMLFGVVIGTKVAVTAYVFIGLSGMYAMARRMGLSKGGAHVSAVVFMTSGFLSTHIAAGQMLWLTIAWVPWVVYFFLSSFRRPWHIVWSAVFFLLILFEGRVYVSAYLVVIIPLITVGLILSGVSWRAGVRKLLVFGVLVACLGAAKIFPTLEFLRDVNGALEETPGIPFVNLPSVFFVRDLSLDYVTPWAKVMWHEYASYTGLLPVALAVLGLTEAIRRRKLFFVVLAAGMMLFLLEASALTVFNFFEYLPVFRELRNPGRHMVMVVFLMAALAGFGADHVLQKINSGRIRDLVALALALVIFADLSTAAWPALNNLFTVEPIKFAREEPFTQIRDHTSSGFHIVAAGHGASDFCPPHVRLWHGLAKKGPSSGGYDDAVFSAYGHVDASLAHFTPNEAIIHTGVARGDDTVVLNQTYDAGWHSPQKTLFAQEGKVAFAVNRSDMEQDVLVQYRPPLWREGLILTVVTVFGLIVIYAWGDFKQKKS